MNIRHIIALSMPLACSVSWGAELQVEPGSLSSALTSELRESTTLTLSGEMDLRDFTTLVDEMPGLHSLDLRDVKIVAWESSVPVSSGPSSSPAATLPANALLGLKLQSLQLPATLVSIEQGALAGNAFTTIELPSTLQSIGDNALYGCTALTEITIPASVTSVGTYALAGCTALQSADLSLTSLTQIPASMFASDEALSTITLPATLREIGDGAFTDTKGLESVSLPSSLQSIGTHAFTGSGLCSISLPEGVSSVGDYAFSQCASLSAASLANPDATLGKGLFYADPEFVILTAEGIKSFPDYLFAADPKAEVAELLPSVSSIGAYALKDNAATTLTFGASLVYLGDGALEGMSSLTDINVVALKDNVPALGSDVFEGIDQPTTTLTVDDNTEDAWRGAEQWKEFKVLAVNTTGEEGILTPDARDVSCYFAGTQLVVKAGTPITSVEVYDPNGAVVASAKGGNHLTLTTDVAHLSGKVYIVRVALNTGGIATFKLTR